MTNIEDALALENQRQASKAAPAGFTPGVTYVNGMPDTLTTPAIPKLPEGDFSSITQYMPFELPDGARLELVAATFDQNTWVRRTETRLINGVERKTPATTEPGWRYRFRVVYDASALPDTDLAELIKAAKRTLKTVPPKKRKRGKTTKVVILGDLQAGKVDLLGGTPELLQRLDTALKQVVRDTKEQRPDEIILVDLGDILEGFESAPNADRTNDLSQTQQIRIVRRILWEWVGALHVLAPSLRVLGVPSNHCHVRRGKQRMGDPLDDYGIENIHAVSDICAANPERYKNVTFAIPEPNTEAVAIEAVGGKLLGFVHGDQFNKPEQAEDYLAKQARGRTPVGQVDILNVGHYHNLSVRTTGDDRWIFVSPTMDNGSAWYTNRAGDQSRPGVLTYLVNPDGWDDMRVAWTS